MQILQWLFKSAHDQERDFNTTSHPTKREAISDKIGEGKDIVLLKHHRAYNNHRTKSKHGFKSLKVFTFICGKDIPKACFYRTINLSRVGNSDKRRNFVISVKMKREELSRGVGITATTKKKSDSASSHGGKKQKKKVLPITEASFTNSNQRKDEQCRNTKAKDQNKGDRKNNVSRMKELLRWAAAAKSEKSGKFNSQKVLQFRRHDGSIKAVPDEDEVSNNESPKISFTWERCSAYSSAISTSSLFKDENAQIVHSPICFPSEQSGHITCTNGYWITTDSEFVVLEL